MATPSVVRRGRVGRARLVAGATGHEAGGPTVPASPSRGAWKRPADGRAEHAQSASTPISRHVRECGRSLPATCSRGRPLTGNPLALVPDAATSTNRRCTRSRASSTSPRPTFLLRPRLPGAACRLRSFTPAGAEVGGAGHNALGAWLWLAASGRLPDPSTPSPAASPHQGSRFGQEIAGEVLPVEVIREPGRPVMVSMDQSPPRFGEPLADRAPLATALGLDEADLDATQPARVVSTGAAHLIVPIRDRAAVDRAHPEWPPAQGGPRGRGW